MKSRHSSVGDAVQSAAGYLQHLPAGNIAELRRMGPMSVSPPTYWKLAVRHSGTISENHDAWQSILRILAILTPKGDPEKRTPLHNPERKLGQVLCDGGNPQWPGAGEAIRPVVSEHRVAQLMSARGKQRRMLLERAMRTVARTRHPDSGVDVVDIARWLLSTDTKALARHLAENYYQRLDHAEREKFTKQNGEDS